MERIKGHFKVKKITEFALLQEGEEIELPESDLCFQDGQRIYQWEYIEPKDSRKFQVEPGIFQFAESTAGINLGKMELRERNLLDTATNTSIILKEARTFFSRLHVYEKLNRPKKRGVLLYSNPGMGKTSAIEKFCHDAMAEDKGTVVLVWPTSQIEADSIANFLTTQSEYTPECTRLVLIIEDIGGGERDGEHGRASVPSGLLNLLDGVGLTFRLPTFIIATTNHPENLLSSLANRPGRFDLMVELQPPSNDEKIKLLEFVCKREVTDDEKEAITMKGTEKFSIAHIEEVVVRAELHDKSFKQVVQELVKHAELFNKNFAGKEKALGFTRDDFD